MLKHDNEYTKMYLFNNTHNTFLLMVLPGREREMFYLTTHSTHFIYGYMPSDIWLRTILIVRKETHCRHIGYSYRLTARVLLYAQSHIQDNTYHGLCYTSRGALAGTRNSSMGRYYQCQTHDHEELSQWCTDKDWSHAYKYIYALMNICVCTHEYLCECAHMSICIECAHMSFCWVCMHEYLCECAHMSICVESAYMSIWWVCTHKYICECPHMNLHECTQMSMF